jgi:predicted nuclease of restriction endonuclease-like (RecB) superfamily
VIERLAEDLRRAFPEMTGISARNLKYMRAFAEAWPDQEFVQQVVAQLPWGHNTLLLDAIKSKPEREWYAHQAIHNGWSRNVFAHQIDSELFARQGGALTNFSRTLPAPQSELAQEIIKDPYSFDFLSLAPDMLERDLERGLIDHLRQLILELGKGFAFVGSQFPMEVGGQDYYLDLLFYHLRLRCFVVIELPSTTCFAIRMTNPRSASFFVKAAIKSLLSTRCAIQPSRWAWRNIGSRRRCPSS